MYKNRRNKKSREKILVCTICCREKVRGEDPLPAIERYRSRRIQKIFRLAEKAGLEFAILSGKFGLLSPDEPISYYDQLLIEADISSISDRIAIFLKEHSIRKILFLLPDPKTDSKLRPYIESMRQGSRNAEVLIRIQYVPPYPDSLP